MASPVSPAFPTDDGPGGRSGGYSIADFRALPIAEQIADGITRRLLGQLPLIVVEHPRCFLVVSEYGAQVLSWAPAGHGDALWTARQAATSGRKAIRGGIPVCWPWFGPAAEPQHGYARISTWRVARAEPGPGGIRLAFELELIPDAYPPGAPGVPATARLDITAGAELEVELTHVAGAPATAALHSYFYVGDIGDTRVSGLPPRHLDKLTGEWARSTSGSRGITGEVDAVYPIADGSSAALTVHSGAASPGGRGSSGDPASTGIPRIGIAVAPRGASDVVVWNPGKPLGDAAAFGEFVCVEPARITRPLQPGESLGMRVSLGG